MAGAKGRSGGKREGAGRPKSYDFKTHVSKADKFIAPNLQEYAQLLDKLARGQVEITREKWVPAALVLVDKVVMHDRGDDANGNPRALLPVKEKVPAFPQVPPTQMVLVERRIEWGQPDLAALMYLCNRIMGNPAPQPEQEASAAPAPALNLTLLTQEELNALETLLEKAAAASGGSERGESKA